MTDTATGPADPHPTPPPTLPLVPTEALRPERSPLFRKWADPNSGVESWILTQRVAPIQQSFYFTNPSFTADGRYLWLYCCFPPSTARTLAVVDFVAGRIDHYPETIFTDASPYVDQQTGEVYWAIGLEVWKRGPKAEDRATLVNTFPAELARNRVPWRLATHLTRSSDGKSFCIDAQIGNQWFVGEMPIAPARPFELWQMFDDCCYNHAQFSPTDPDVILIAQDGWHDAATGEPGRTRDRLWLIRRGQQARPLLPDFPLSSDHRGHEWWDAGGEHVWYIDYRNGTEKVNIRTGKRTNVWPAGHTHSHCDHKGQFLVGDICPAADDWRLAFFNTRTGRQIDIVSRFPVHPSAVQSRSLSALTPNYNRSHYHVHPHPQFCSGDKYIAYTTNVFGTIDVALVPTEQLAPLTASIDGDQKALRSRWDHSERAVADS